LGPEQWLFVGRFDLADTMCFGDADYLSSSFIGCFITLRDSLCRIYYEGDVVDSIVRAETIGSYGIYPAVKIEGLWRNDSSLWVVPLFLILLMILLAGKDILLMQRFLQQVRRRSHF
jgi:hypothetical protein